MVIVNSHNIRTTKICLTSIINFTKKRLSYRRKYIEEFVWGSSLFWLHFLLFFVFFFFIFVYSNFTKKKILLQEMLAPYPSATPSVYGTDFTSLYILEKIVKKHKKCVRYKKSKSLFFDVLENIAKFSLQKLAFFKMITDSHIHILRLLPYMGKTRYPSKSQFFKSHFSTKW